MATQIERAPVEGTVHEETSRRPIVTVWHVTADITPPEVHKLAHDLALASNGRFEVDLLSDTIEIGSDVVGVGHPGVVVLVTVYEAVSVFVARRLDIKELR